MPMFNAFPGNCGVYVLTGLYSESKDYEAILKLVKDRLTPGHLYGISVVLASAPVTPGETEVRPGYKLYEKALLECGFFRTTEKPLFRLGSRSNGCFIYQFNCTTLETTPGVNDASIS